MTARFATLDQWLAWQETLHPKAMDLGLERVEWVRDALGIPARPGPVVITVGGTNGKGSTVALLEAILRAGGYRVGSYTSPHLLRYNERVRLDGVEATDAALCRAFARIDAARGNTSLTYFEFGTLAAWLLFLEGGMEVIVQEVGLGGRLDAVNVLEPDAALVTSVDLDHQEWLGPDREAIGREKAGIFRPHRPAVCGDPDPPASLLAQVPGARLYRQGVDFGQQGRELTWDWWGPGGRLLDMPLPALAGRHQLYNAAGVLMVLTALADRLPLEPDAIRRGLTEVRLAGRFQVVPGPVEWLLDVTHNPHGAAALAATLDQRPCRGRTLAVLAMLGDKDPSGVVRALGHRVDHWYPASLEGPRAGTVEGLVRALTGAGVPETAITGARRVTDACRQAAGQAVAGDRILVFGSFHTVAAALEAAPWADGGGGSLEV